MAAIEKTVNTVTMTDGAIVEFPGKRKLQKTSIVADNDVLQVRLDFVNGEFRLFTLPPALVATFALHGAEQKLGDEISGLDDINDCVLAIDTLIDRLYEGKWNATREANGMAGASILARALVEQSGKDMATIRTFLSDKTQAQKVALRQNPAIKPIVDRLEAEKAKKPSKNAIDTDALLGSLSGDAGAAEAAEG